MMSRRGARRLRVSRDSILFAVGLLGIAYETILEGGDKPTLLILFGAMVGLPAFLRTDEKAKAAADTAETKPAIDPPPAAPPGHGEEVP